MINVYNCGYEPTEEEIKILLESLRPGQKVPLLNDWMSPEGYHKQLICENYLQCSLPIAYLRFVTNKYIKEPGRLIDNRRLQCIIFGIGYPIERRGLDLHFECEYG